ncbi:MAG: PD-(D/E)XK nuclease family protein [Candidatus Omnitrophica bacterium]|nr:PD-(D/E)XK nuclease family protein [Candidatus Omnitrophota bacterium]
MSVERVITYNLSDNFILKLTDYIEENYLKGGRDISRLLFIFGGRRPALFLKKELASRIKKSFLAPRFFSIDEFVEYILSKKEAVKPVSDLDACYSIYSLAKSVAPDVVKGREKFCAFLPWAREILSFIEQLDLEDTREELLQNVQSKARIGFDVPENINALLGSIILIRKAYQGLLKDKKTYSRGLKYLSAAKCIREVNLDEFEQAFFCGFFYLHKTEEEIISSLYEMKKATLVFQGSQNDWGVLNKLAEKFSISIQPRNPEVLQPNFTVQAGFDVHSQVCLAREALKKINDPAKTVVVLPNPDNVIPLLAEISAHIEDFNVSLGYPLKRSSLYALLAAIFKAQNNKKGTRYYARDYLAALSHPLIKNLRIFPNPGLTRVLAHKIEEVLLGIEETALAGSLFIGLKEIAGSRELYESSMRTIKSMGLEVSYAELEEAVEKLHQVLFESWEGLDNLYDFSLVLNGLVSMLIEKSPLGNYPLNLKMAEELFKVKDELGAAEFRREKFPQEDIFKIFENKLENQVISFSGSPLKGLQVLGLLETRSLNFENVVMLDMNESVLPNLKIYEPLIPREVMINLGINRLEKEDQIQRYQFMRLISSAKNTVLIYQDTPDKEKSRFIEELVWSRQKIDGAAQQLLPAQAAFKLKVLPKRLEISKDARIIEFLKSREYSSSSINTYLSCPLKFYYQYVLGLEEKEDLLDEPEAKDIGTFIHEFFKDQFSCFLHKRPVIDSKFRKDFLKALEDKFEREFQQKARSDAFMIKEVLIFRMEKFLDNENSRNVSEILCLEKTFSDTITFSCGKVRFKAILDRIDLLETRSALILDYKTGGSNVMPKTDSQEIESAGFTREAIKKTIRSFQLPLYLYIVSTHPQFREFSLNACLYFIKDLKQNKGLSPLFKKELVPEQRERLIRTYLKALDCIIRDILDPAVVFKADEEDLRLCASCPFVYLCR